MRAVVSVGSAVVVSAAGAGMAAWLVVSWLIGAVEAMERKSEAMR